MAFVRAKKDVFLAPEDGGFRHEGEEFEYSGPNNENLEATDKQPYYGFSASELAQEVARRRLPMPPPQNGVMDHKSLNAILVADDANKKQKPITAQPIEKAPDGSGTDKYGASDWTDAGNDINGFPVENGSQEDVSVKHDSYVLKDDADLKKAAAEE